MDINAPTKQWEIELEDAIFDAVVATLRSKLPIIQPKIALAIRRAVNASQAITSMLGGQLQAEFGFVEPAVIVKRLLDAIEKSIEIDFGVEDFVLHIIIDKTKLIASGVGEFSSKGGDVPWLEWLLSSGGKVVISDYHIEYGVFPKKSRFAGSRSGSAKMVPGGTYAVQKFSGTKERNFITDAIDEKALREIGEAIRSSL